MTPTPLENAGTRSDVLKNLGMPSGIIATGVSAGTEWQHGEHRNLEHDTWLLCTTDRNKKKDDTTYSVSFDAVVDVGGVLLTDPNRHLDLLTKKVMVARRVGYGDKGRQAGAEGTSKLALYMDWFVRWRLSIGIETNARLLPHHFEDYLERLRSATSINDLVPLIERLHAYVAEIEKGNTPSPVLLRRGGAIEWGELSLRMGVSIHAIARSCKFRNELVKFLPIIDPANSDAVASVLSRRDADDEAPSKMSGLAKGALHPWTSLWRLSSIGLLPHDPLGFDPADVAFAKKLRKQSERALDRTATIDPPDLLRLMSAAAKWVLDYSDHILQVWRTTHSEGTGRDAESRDKVSVNLHAQAPDGLPLIRTSLRDMNSGSDERTAMGAAVAIRHLMTACAILVGTFGARRVNEIQSLRADCLVEQKPGMLEMTIYIEKTLRELDAIPVPSMIRRVVEVLEELTASTRQETGRDWLFEVRRTYAGSSSQMLDFDLTSSLDSFAMVNGLKSGEDDDRWHFRAHQLRRGFAVAYYHGFEGATLDALSRFMRHSDPEMTRVYINEIMTGSIGWMREEIGARQKVSRATMTEPDRKWIKDAEQLLQDMSDRGREFESVRCEALVSRMISLWGGKDSAIGMGAARLYDDLDAMVRDASAEVRLGSRSNDTDAAKEPLIRLLQTYATDHYLEPVPGHASHCMCKPHNTDDLAQAECLKLKSASRRPWANGQESGHERPDYAFASAYVCLSCSHCAAFKTSQSFIGNLDERLQEATVKAASPSAKTSAAERLASLRAAVRSAHDVVKERS